MSLLNEAIIDLDSLGVGNLHAICGRCDYDILDHGALGSHRGHLQNVSQPSWGASADRDSLLGESYHISGLHYEADTTEV